MATDIYAEYEFRDGHWRLLSGEIFTPPAAGGTPAAWKASGGYHAWIGTGGTLSLPTPYAVGDLAFILAETANQAPTVPSGWAHVPNSPLGTGTGGAAGSVMLSLLWKRITSLSEPDVTFAAAGDHILARAFIYGPAVAGPGSPFDDTAGAADLLASASTAVSIPAGVTTVDQALILLCATNGIDSATDQYTATLVNAALSAIVKRANTNFAGGVGGGYMLADGLKAAAGAVGATTTTMVASGKQARLSVAILPTGSGSGGGGGGPGTFRTYLGAMGTGYPLGGTPYRDEAANNIVPSQFLGDLATWRANSMAGIRRFTNNVVVADAGGYFSPALYINNYYKPLVDAINAVGGGMTTVRQAVADGVMRGFWTLDDFTTAGGANGFTRAVTFEEIEAICRYQKTGESVIAGVATNAAYAMPWMPLLARGPSSYMKSIAAAGSAATDLPGYVRINGIRQYRFLDAAWGQWRPDLDLAASSYVSSSITDGLACGLGCQFGVNALDHGKGTDAGWGCTIFHSGECSCSPTEILAIGRAVIAEPKAHGLAAWSYGASSAYFENSQIKAAFQTLWDESQGRKDGLLNVRGDLVAA